MDPTWLADRVAEIRERLTGDDEGDLWALFLDEGNMPMLAIAVTRMLPELDETLLRNLAHILEDVGAAGVLLAIPRRRGAPMRVDRALWRYLVARLAESDTPLVDLVVVGPGRFWSARHGNNGAAAA